jgi:predicted regulator of Ras-like GTPase activity (Roadblock/LC7/MglB family)
VPGFVIYAEKKGAMKETLNDIMSIEGVHGLLVLSAGGRVILNQFAPRFADEQSRFGKLDLGNFTQELSNTDEAEFVFDRRRLYARKTGSGFLLVVLDDLAPLSMVRLNCEILLPALDRVKQGSRIGQLFKKKIF